MIGWQFIDDCTKQNIFRYVDAELLFRCGHQVYGHKTNLRVARNYVPFLYRRGEWIELQQYLTIFDKVKVDLGKEEKGEEINFIVFIYLLNNDKYLFNLYVY